MRAYDANERIVVADTPVQWTSVHTGRWHTSEFFLVQDEQARPGGAVFDTLSVMGLDAKTGRYFARTFENHGFCRDYDLSVDGNRWHLSGETERATITFSDDSRTQTIAWEWKACRRVAPSLRPHRGAHPLTPQPADVTWQSRTP